MKTLKWLSVVLLLLVLLAAPALTQSNADRQKMSREARQVWQQSETFRLQGKYKEAKIGYDALITAYGTLGQPRFVEASRQMSELCAAMPIDLKKLKDGVYTGTAKGYVADITLELTIKDGKITALRTTQHKENRPRTALEAVPAGILKSQSPSVDAVTGATITSCAVMSATRNAIAQAQPAETPAKKP